MGRWTMAAGALFIAALATLAPGLAPPASACSIFPGTLELSAEYSEVIVVGEVISERPIDSPIESHESIVRIAATLKGNSTPTLTISPTGWLGPGCEGNPRLPAGERVLLFLVPSRLPGAAVNEPEAGPLQVAGYENGLWHFLENGGAVSAGAEPKDLSAEEAIRRTAAIARAPQHELEAALAFASPGEPTHSLTILGQPMLPREDVDDEGVSPWVAGPAMAGGAVVLVTMALVARMALRRQRGS